MAGELELVLLTEGKILTGLHFIKLLMYYNHDRISVSALRNWYAAFLKAMELGQAKWGDDHLVYAEPIYQGQG